VRRIVLLNPGPVNVTDRVRRASVAAGDVCHREPEYRRLAERIRKLLLRAFAPRRPEYEAVLLTGSGTAAVEAAVASAVPPDGKLLVVENGVYGERMSRMAGAHGIPVVRLGSDWLERPDLDELSLALERDEEIAAVALVHHETTTGLLNPVEKVGRIVHRHGRTLILDAVSSLAAEPLDLARAHVGLCACTANKGVRGLPGVSFVLVRSDLMQLMADYPRRSVYLHLPDYHRDQEAGTVPFTPAVPAAYALAEALRELLAEGVEQRIRLTRETADLLRRGLFDLGFEMLLSPELRANALTAVRLPEGLPDRERPAERKRRGFVIYAGQGPLARGIFRVANLGDVSREEYERFLEEIGRLLKRRGRETKQRGRGTKRRGRGAKRRGRGAKRRGRETKRRRPAAVRRAIILAAGRGKRLGSRGRLLPKCLLRVGGEPLLWRNLRTLRRLGVREVVMVVGHLAGAVRRGALRAAEALPGLSVRFVENPKFERGSILSLHAARRFLDRPVLLMDADVYCGASLVRRLLNSAEQNAVLLDAGVEARGEEMMLAVREGRVCEISRRPDRSAELLGEGVGFYKFGRAAAKKLAAEATAIVRAGEYDEEYETAVRRLLPAVRVGFERVDDLPWTEIDFPGDLERADREFRLRMGPED